MVEIPSTPNGDGNFDAHCLVPLIMYLTFSLKYLPLQTETETGFIAQGQVFYLLLKYLPLQTETETEEGHS